MSELFEIYYNKQDMKKLLDIKSDITLKKYIDEKNIPKPRKICGKEYWHKTKTISYFNKK